MALEDKEVLVTLLPLGHDEVRNRRVIKLNKDRRECPIGRASKNANKGLLADCNNAWFDYPILSRTHAKLTVSLPLKTDLEEQTLYLQDCGSTHGTFLQKRKLESGIDYSINTGEMITFGQRVTSGSVTYPPKDFRLNLEWRTSSNAPAAPPSNPATTSTFQVPDEDNDSVSDVFDVSSREGSVQILDSHARAFSVPATESDYGSDDSDVESIDTPDSIQDEKSRDRRSTKPISEAAADEVAASPVVIDIEGSSESVSTQSKTRGLHLKGPSITKVLSRSGAAESSDLGTSRTDVIDIDKDTPDQSAPGEETEDDGPEELPIQTRSSNVANSTSRNRQSSINQVSTAIDEMKDAGHDNKDQAPGVSFMMQVKALEDPRLSPPPPLNVEFGVSDGFDSTDDDGFDVDDEFSVGCPEEPFRVPDYESPDRAGPRKRFLPPIPDNRIHPSRKLTANDLDVSRAMPSASKPDHLDKGVSNGISISQTPFNDYLPQQREPSPSDAALARNSLDMPTVSSTYDTPSCHYIESSQRFNWPGSTQQTTDSDSRGYPNFIPPNYPESLGNDTLSKPYNQGPFADRYHTEIAPLQPTINTFFNPSVHQHQQQQKADSSGLRFPTYQDLATDAQYAAKLQAEEDVYAYAFHSSSNAINSSALTSKSGNGSEGQSSKINISSLVNASQSEDSRPRKRKADEMQATLDIEMLPSLRENTDYAAAQASQKTQSHSHAQTGHPEETQLPDAQAREDLQPVETLSLTQESTVKPTTNCLLVPSVAKVEEPARKRARTSSSSSKGIGKFLSGVCVGLVGAFATFVATIPDSVRQEALRELQNAS
ncbi:hypothetical protein ACLMJK_000586 [Lecanora helva]